MYRKFKSLNLDTSYIGLGGGDTEGDYFCTPVGTTVIGWEGVDGIHYGFINGFDDMVFAINPMSCIDRYVYPLAENFRVFIELLLAYKSVTQLEQIVNWDNKEEFEKLVFEEEIIPEQQSILNTLEVELAVKPFENAFVYVKSLQQSFDYSKLKFTDEYYEVLGLSKP